MKQLELFGDQMTNDNKENFSQHPLSLAEARAEKERDGRLWKPRDVLISLLRDIDNGVLNPDVVIIVHKTTRPNGNYALGTASAGGSGRHELVGILSEASLSIIEE